MEPVISVLIITYNRPEDTLDLLKNIAGQKDLTKYVGEVLLLNNHSSDSYAEVEDFITKNPTIPIVYFNHSENLGVARGRNFLIEKASCPLLLVVDDDVIFPDQDAFKKLAHLFERPEFEANNTALITFSVFYFDTGERQQNALPHKQFELYKNKDWFLTYYFTGCAHIMKRELFAKTGLYPVDFFYGMEEYDLSYRIINMDYTLGYDSSVRLFHKESSKGRVTNRQKLSMLWYNKSVVAWRYLPNQYYFSTAFMWGMQYLLKTRFDVAGYFKTMRKVAKIPQKVTTQKISQKAMKYLRTVNARLWY